MVAPVWHTRLTETTRGRIVELLRRASRTVDELARELELTDNAVRAHLGSLERDGVVRVHGLRRDGGVGKPATIYEIAPEAEPEFSNAYLPFLQTLLAALGDRLSPAAVADLMHDVGRRLAAAQPVPGTGDVATRTEAASRLLNSLGALTAVERDAGHLRIRGCGCPLSVAVAQRAEVCAAVQTMLREVIGADVREHCDRGERPRCRFEVIES